MIQLLAVTVILCLVGGSAHAARASRIELVDSMIFNDVDYLVDNAYKVITITGAGVDRTVSFTQIKLILDASGKDVTEDCLGRSFRPTTRPLLESEKPVSDASAPTVSLPSLASTQSTVPGPRHPFRTGFRLATNYSFPASDWYDGTRSGIGFEGDFLVTVGRRIALRASLSKSGVRHDIDALMGGLMVLSDGLNWEVWRYFLSVQYYNWPRWRTGGRMMYSVYTGLGAVSHQLTGSAVGYDPVDDMAYILEGNGNAVTKFAMNTGCGLTAMATNTLGFECSFELDIVFLGSTDTPQYYYYRAPVNVATAGLVDLKFGVVILFR